MPGERSDVGLSAVSRLPEPAPGKATPAKVTVVPVVSAETAGTVFAKVADVTVTDGADASSGHETQSVQSVPGTGQNWVPSAQVWYRVVPRSQSQRFI